MNSNPSTVTDCKDLSRPLRDAQCVGNTTHPAEPEPEPEPEPKPYGRKRGSNQSTARTQSAMGRFILLILKLAVSESDQSTDKAYHSD